MLEFRNTMDKLYKLRPFRKGGWQYQALAQTGKSEEQDGESVLQSSHRPLKRKGNWLKPVVIVSGLLMIILFLYLSTRHDLPSTCSNPVSRREWRTLHASEQQDYIKAVLCLSEKPSIFEPGSSRYDDFAYAHIMEGTMSHYASAFLPWHRYFLHVFEKALVEECSYSGTLTYWDWGLDAADIVSSPIWDIDTGFGGNGSDPSLGPVFYGGHCILEGPFANATRHWQSKWNGHGFDPASSPHCLSRGFLPGEKEKAEFETNITPEAIELVLGYQDYTEFLDSLEMQAHNSIPQIVRGDFYLGTAPNDPVFYLHHGQVDRLWWIWQQRDPKSRMYEYHGQAENTVWDKSIMSTESSVEDLISIGEFADPVSVRELMDTRSGFLCYNYQ